jgi:beta-phosphoglucomutase family hydrolase
VRDRAAGTLPIRSPFAAVIFDMDGVVTDTAAVHARAWKRLFDEVLQDARLGVDGPEEPFDPAADYRLYVDGRSREDGVRAFLSSRDIHVPEGQGDDGAHEWSIAGLAKKKNAIFLELVAEQGVRVFPGTADLLARLRAGHVPTGLVTASRNASALLAAAGASDWFDSIVDGTVAREMRLPGKPDPAMFLEAARRLGVAADRIAVVEDAVVGVQAARRGGFGLVVGVARQGNRAPLEAVGADLVVEDVGQLDLGVLRSDPWTVCFRGFDPAHEGHREALTTLSNGYLGTRGAAPESVADGVHYPGTYLAGVYNRLTSVVEGRAVQDEHLVNVPNWLFLDLRIGQGAWWSNGGLRAEEEHVDLDLRRAVLLRRLLLVDDAGRRLRVVQRRLVSMTRPHVAGLSLTIQAESWAGTVTVRSGVDAAVTNSGVAEYHSLANRHLGAIRGEQLDAHGLLVDAETVTSRIRVSTAVRHLFLDSQPNASRHVQPRPGCHVLDVDLDLPRDGAITVDKTVAIVTSRDTAIASPREGAVAELRRAPVQFADLLREHEAAWTELWQRFALDVSGLNDHDRLVLNLHLFHLMQTVTMHTAGLDAGIPARGLHGEGYRGHVFWDELFVLPILATQTPAAARAVLEYRWRRLPAAREAARRQGLIGALFPWQSGSDGREETPERLYNARSQRWMADNSWRQRHVGLAVAYNAWQYFATTADLTWLAERGGHLIVEVTRMFASSATYDVERDRFHIDGVMGPDEFHDGYPDAPGRGLRDNAYTNVMTAWVCSRALEVLALLRGQACDELVSALDVAPDEPARWEALQRRLTVPFHDGVISQFAGYEDLEELDWQRYRADYGTIGRLDLILEAEGDSTNRYRLAKQADVLMLVYLLGVEELVAMVTGLGYPLTRDDVTRSVDYYLARTAHGSTLSRVVHASVLAQVDKGQAWRLFREALAADIDDTQGGTTREGIHLGAMAGTVDLVRKAFAGLRPSADELVLDPHLPEGLGTVSFRVHYQGHHVSVRVAPDGVRAEAHECETPHVLQVTVDGSSVPIAPGDSHFFPRDAAISTEA